MFECSSFLSPYRFRFLVESPGNFCLWTVKNNGTYQLFTGALGEHMVRDQFEVWICFLHYTCEGAPGPLPGAQANSMCWVYNEARRLFVPWCEPLRPHPMSLVGFPIRPATLIAFMSAASTALRGCCSQAPWAF